MRIIAGKYKNSVILAPEGNDTRPSKDMLKEAMFSSIGFFRGDESILDLFGGSGAIGLEALSRGAKKAIINDISKNAYNIIKTNVNKLKADAQIYNLDYVDLLNKLDEKFDIIFLDPPYIFNEYEKLMRLINDNNLLKDDGIIIWEVEKNTKMNDKYEDYTLYKTKKYGISLLNYYKGECDE